MLEEIQTRPVGQKVFFAYYAATPIFAVLDFYFGANVRVVALEHLPTGRFIYYTFCLVVLFFDYRDPDRTRWLGLLESCFNLFLLVMSIALPVFTLPEKLLAGEEVSLPFDGPFFINFFIAGAICMMTFYRNLFELQRAGDIE